MTEYLPQQIAAVESLLSRVPEFAETRARDTSFISHGRNDAPYLVFGDFGLFLLKRLTESPSHAQSEWWELINEMLNSNDPHISNLIHVGVLEVLSDDPVALAIAKRNLSALA